MVIIVFSMQGLTVINLKVYSENHLILHQFSSHTISDLCQFAFAFSCNLHM